MIVVENFDHNRGDELPRVRRLELNKDVRLYLVGEY